MIKFIDIALELIFFVYSMILWIYGMVLSDIQGDIPRNDFITLLIKLTLFAVFYSIYIKKSKRKQSIILLIPLLLWMPLVPPIIWYNRNIYWSIISGMGTITTGYCFVLSVYKLLKHKIIFKNR